MEKIQFESLKKDVQSQRLNLREWFGDYEPFDDDDLQKFLKDFDFDILKDKINDIICEHYSDIFDYFFGYNDFEELSDEQKEEINEIAEYKIFSFDVVDFLPKEKKVEIMHESDILSYRRAYWHTMPALDFSGYYDFCRIFGTSSYDLRKILERKGFSVEKYKTHRKRYPAISDGVLEQSFSLCGIVEGYSSPIFLVEMNVQALAGMVQDGAKKEDLKVSFDKKTEFALYCYYEGSVLGEVSQELAKPTHEIPYKEWIFRFDCPMDNLYGYRSSVYRQGGVSFSL